MEATTSTAPTVMMICPNLKCRKVLQVPAQYRGLQVRCHYCNMTFAVPTGKANEKSGGEGKDQ
ncbi:MAG TPA: hypothetical protein VJZ71_02115 [Phycisphaerae bacterium]|nr:hypothetical protein [Phycisphaerae bacterium]